METKNKIVIARIASWSDKDICKSQLSEEFTSDEDLRVKLRELEYPHSDIWDDVCWMAGDLHYILFIVVREGGDDGYIEKFMCE